MYFDNNFYITLRNCDMYIFHNELFYSKNIFPIPEDFLIKNYYDDYFCDDINKCFQSYLYEQIFELLDIELFYNDNIIIDPSCDQIKKYKIDIDKSYYETINFILIEAYELNCSPLIKFFIKNLCMNHINRNLVIDYIAIFRYVSQLFIFDIYQFRKNNYNSSIYF